MSLTLVTAPAQEPVAMIELKDFLAVDTADDDVLLHTLLEGVRELIDGKDGWLGRALITQTWDVNLPGFPRSCDRPEEDGLYGITIPLPPLQSITTITYRDGNGVVQTLAPTAYDVDTKAEPGRVIPAYGMTWPSTRPGPNAVTVRFVCGYGGPANVPDALKMWLKNGVGYHYQQREAGTLPDLFFWSISAYRIWTP